MCSLGEVRARGGSSFLQPQGDPACKAKAQLFDLTGQSLWAEPTTSYSDPSMTAFSFFWSRV